MQLAMSFGENGRMSTVEMSGRLDLAAATEFAQLVHSIRDVVGGEVTLDLSRVAVADGAGRSAMENLVHECREYGGRLRLPVVLQAGASPAVPA